MSSRADMCSYRPGAQETLAGGGHTCTVLGEPARPGKASHPPQGDSPAKEGEPSTECGGTEAVSFPQFYRPLFKKRQYIHMAKISPSRKRYPVKSIYFLNQSFSLFA